MQSIKLKLSLFFMSFFVIRIQYSVSYVYGFESIILYGYDTGLRLNSKYIEAESFLFEPSLIKLK